MSSSLVSTGVQFPDGSIQTTRAAQIPAFTNRIINGAMQVDQRNAGASVTPTDGSYTLDRWSAKLTQASKFTVQQTPSATESGYATRVGAGFTSYLAATSSSAYTVLSTDWFYLQQVIEGLNVSDLAWGTSNAKAVTLSFWVYSSLTGTFGGSVFSGAGGDASYPYTYTISSANTWTQISVTIPGPTIGTWPTTNIGSVWVTWGLGIGSNYTAAAGSWAAGLYRGANGCVNVVGTSGAKFYITGVQLEKGSTATSFDYRPYGTELQLCQRYYANVPDTIYYCGYGNSPSSVAGANISYPVPMRASPTVTGGTGSAGSSFSIAASGAFYAFGNATPTSASSPRIAGYTATAEL